MPDAAPRDPFQLAGTILEGRFVVERVVAEGGFGVVYYAHQATLERPIALKVLKTPAQFDEGQRKAFLAGFAAEAKTIARITHPSIVQVYDFGVSRMPSGAEAGWMALEWLTGVTLEDELLRRRGRGGRSPSECLSLLKPALAALGLVHAQGVAHRDIKPANIMLVPTAAGTTLKLLDFGIAKIMDADEAPGTGHTRTRSSQVAFSPGYAAPEQISQGRTGPWTDVHAMALVLTEVLTDSAPFKGNEMAVLFQQIVDRVRPTPAKLGVDVGAWEAVLQRALSVPSAERFRDAGELLRALEETVTAAGVPHVSIPDDVLRAAGLPSEARREDTLAVMSTQMAGPSNPPSPSLPEARATTHSPISQDGPTRPPRSAPLPWIVGAAAVVAMGGLLLYRGVSGSPPAAPAAFLVPPVAATSMPSAALIAIPTPASAAGAVAAPSASPSAVAAPAPSSSAPSRRSPSRTAGGGATPAAPPGSSRIVIE
jgi:serine/threonine protein kinase